MTATGSGSTLNLSGLTSLSGATLYNPVYVTANAGARVDLSRVASSAGGLLAFASSGSGSVIDLSRLPAVVDTDTSTSSDSSLSATSGGAIVDPALASLSRADLTVDATGVLGTAQVTSDASGVITVIGATPSFSGLTSVSGDSVYAYNGATVRFPNVTSYAGSGSGTSTTLLAGLAPYYPLNSYTGTAAVLDLSTLASLSGATLYNPVYVTANAGARVDLSRVASSAGGLLAFASSGSGSVIDLSRLPAVVDTDTSTSSDSSLSATSGGAIVDPALASLSRADLTVDATGVLGTAQVTSDASGVITVIGATPSFSGLTSVSGDSVYAYNGATVRFPNVTSYAGSGTSTTLLAGLAPYYPLNSYTGTAAVLDLSTLASLSGATLYNPVYVTANAGARVDLSRVASISGGSVSILASGSGSIVNLISLASLVQSGSSNSSLQAQSSGYIALKGSSSANSNTGIIIGVGGSLSVSGKLQINGTGLVNSGDLEALDGSSLTVNTPVTLNGLARIWNTPSATLSFASGVLGNTQNASQYDPLGELLFNGSGTATSPQQLEVMSADLGLANASYANNFLYNFISITNNTYVKLVDQSDNSVGTGAEALYVNSIVVTAGSTLNLNGLHVYARGVVVAGTVLNGTIAQTPDSGPISFASPTPGQISIVGQDDEWTFFGRAGQSVTVNVDPGSNGSAVQLTPYLGYGSVQILDVSGNVLASASSASSGQQAILSSVNLPADGTYRIEIRAASSHASSTGNYVVGVFDTTPSIASLPLNQQVNGAISNPYSVDEWTFSSTAGRQVIFNLLNSSNTNIKFDLTGPAGWTGFSGL